MTEALSLMYGIDVPSRSVTGLPAEPDRTLFMVGTLSLKHDNQICLLEVDDDWLQISNRSFPHTAGEVWHLSSSPINSYTLATAHSSFSLLLLCFNAYRCEFHAEGRKIAIATNKTVHVADVNEGLKVDQSTTMDNSSYINAVAWDPRLNSNALAVAFGSSVKGIDTRTRDEAFFIKKANIQCVRNLDYNPNMQHILATCGDDCCVSLWDIRTTTVPLKIIHNHSHWVWCVKFNPIHDQLLLSVGSDARLFLESIETLSSESLNTLALGGDESDEQTPKRLGDQRLEKVEEHEDSIYACAWAGNDPWVFASVSFDGRVIISRVKRHHKYAILRL